MYLKIVMSLICFFFVSSSISFIDAVFSYNYPAIQTPVETQKVAVEKLIIRLLGSSKSTLFTVEIANHNATATDFVSLVKMENEVHIIATSGVAAAYGFHHYLKYYCKCHISWDYDQLDLPFELPSVNTTLRSFDTYRYYQNVCTYSYSYVWWTWKRWEREIDWMALNGINLALAFTGQEAVWLQVYKLLNLTESEINEHFAGVAFLAWQRMANIRGWRGPLFETWFHLQVTLQLKILRRMKSLGIIPILPAFCGHVPRAIKRLYPKAKMTRLPPWAAFSDKYCCPYLLEPEEALFNQIGQMFYQEQEKLFGTTSHFYNCDIFNEMRPSSNDLNYLKNMSAAVFTTLDQNDPSSIWIMQGWLFASDPAFWTLVNVEHFLAGVPNDRMIILDLQSEIHPLYEILNSYFGKPFIWCMLHNFGGTHGMHGSFDVLNNRVVEARSLSNSTLLGTGITPEGINQNYVMYDFMMETSWRNASTNIDLWIENYSERRYGTSNTNLKAFWLLLRKSVYNYKLIYPLHGQYTLVLRPSLSHAPWTWYNTSDISNAWICILNVTKNDLSSRNTNYQYDLVDVTRQVLQNLFDFFYKNTITSFSNRNISSFEDNANHLLEVLLDLNSILSTDEHFMLGLWLHGAKSKSVHEDEEQILEMNARNQITLWGPNGEIRDYAAKQWAGLFEDYYYKRWNLFVQYLRKSLLNEEPFKQHIFDAQVFKLIEEPFTYSRKVYPFAIQNDSYVTSKKLYSKWERYLMIPVLADVCSLIYSKGNCLHVAVNGGKEGKILKN